MKLTNHKVANAKPGKHQDEYGLHLRVSPKGAKTWIQRLTIKGARTDNSLGSHPLLSLTEARKVAFARWQIAKEGGDPRVEGPARKTPTFREALDDVIELNSPTWSSGLSERQWRNSLANHAGAILDMQISEIGAADVMAVLEPIWNTNRETATRIRQRISMVCQYAISKEWRTDDAAGDAVKAALPKRRLEAPKGFEAMPYDLVPAFLADVRNLKGAPVGRLALEFVVLTMTRSSETRLARWDEIDLANALWTVPASRMKAKREHRIPLSARAVALLREALALTDGGGFVFPGQSLGKPIGASCCIRLLKRLGYQYTLHGFRSTARDWMAEQTSTPHAVMEAALAHTIRNKSERAYARSDLLERRARIMELWSNQCTGDAGDNVIRLDIARSR